MIFLWGRKNVQQLLQTTGKCLNSSLKYSVFPRVFLSKHFIVFLENQVLRTGLGKKQDATRKQNRFETRTYMLKFAYEVCGDWESIFTCSQKIFSSLMLLLETSYIATSRGDWLSPWEVHFCFKVPNFNKWIVHTWWGDKTNTINHLAISSQLVSTLWSSLCFTGQVHQLRISSV